MARPRQMRGRSVGEWRVAQRRERRAQLALVVLIVQRRERLERLCGLAARYSRLASPTATSTLSTKII